MKSADVEGFGPFSGMYGVSERPGEAEKNSVLCGAKVDSGSYKLHADGENQLPGQLLRPSKPLC